MVLAPKLKGGTGYARRLPAGSSTANVTWPPTSLLVVGRQTELGTVTRLCRIEGWVQSNQTHAQMFWSHIQAPKPWP